MDVESFKAAFELGGQALSMLKNARDLLPSSPEKEAASQTLIEAEKAFHIAEAKAAQELGYELCQCTWPPQIMLLNTETGQFSCSICSRLGGGKIVSAAQLVHQEPNEEKNGVTEEENSILKLIYELGDQGYQSELIAERLGIPHPKVEYFLQRLGEAEYLYVAFNMMSPTEYSLDQKGREYLIHAGVM